MRVSTKQLQLLGIKAILDQQSNISRLQNQIATGKKITTPADDPAGAARILDLRQAIATTTQYQENINFVRQRLELEDTTLASTEAVLQRVRELAIQANNDTQSPDTRQMIAREVRQRVDDLLALANTRDANGEFIFAGYQKDGQPFIAETDGTFTYNGDAGQRYLQISATRQVADGDNGTAVFRDITTGNGVFEIRDNAANTGTGVIDPGTVVDQSALDGDTYSIAFSDTSGDGVADTYQVLDSAGNLEATGTYEANAAIRFNGIETFVRGAPDPGDQFTVRPSVAQDVFTTVQNLALALETGADDPQSITQLHNAINRVLSDMDRAEGNVLEVRAAIGARLNAADSQQSINEDFSLGLKSTLSSIEDIDLAEAASLLQQQLTGLEAAQAAFVRVQGLSLFDFL